MQDDPGVDVQAVQRDAELLDVLAVRGDLGSFAGDPLVELLGPWVASIDAGVDPAGEAPEQGPAAVLPGPRRTRGRAGLVAGATVAVLVVSGGAAAAVTGDPLAVVRAPIEALERVNPFGNGPEAVVAALPEPAAPAAEPNKLLADAQRALAQGDDEEAARLLAAAQSLLGDTANPGQQQRIVRLQDRLEDNQAQGKQDNQAQGKQDNQAQGKQDNQAQGKQDNQAQGKQDESGAGAGDPGQQRSSSPSSDTGDPAATDRKASPAEATSGAQGAATSDPGGQQE